MTLVHPALILSTTVVRSTHKPTVVRSTLNDRRHTDDSSGLPTGLLRERDVVRGCNDQRDLLSQSRRE